MWSLWRTSKETNSRPSDLVCVEDRLAAYCLDAAVVTFGTIIENALQERVNVGSEKQPRYEAKFSITQLLAPDFTLPQAARSGQQSSAGSQQSFQSGVAQVLALAAAPRSGVKRWEYKLN